MKLVVDVNVVISALIADSKTRELVVTLEPKLLTPKVIHGEIGNHEALIVEKSGMDADRVQQFVDLLFQYIETVPASEFYPYIEEAEEAIVTLTLTTCCTWPARSLVKQVYGATIPISMNKTSCRCSRRVRSSSRSTLCDCTALNRSERTVDYAVVCGGFPPI